MNQIRRFHDVQYDSAARRLYFPDGSFWYMGATSSGLEDDAGTLYPTLMQDTNGNQVTVRYSYGGGTLIPDSSARIARIEDFRGPSGVTYVFGWAGAPDLHISSISSQIGTSESWSFGIQLAARVSPFDSSEFGSEGALLSLTRTGVNLSQAFTYDTSGELTTLTTPLGGSFRWDYRSFTYSTGSRTLREVQYRYLTKAPGAAETTYTLAYNDATSGTVHTSTALGDPSGPSRAWLFFTDGTGPFGALARYATRTAFSCCAVHRRDFTYAQDSVGRNYIASVLTTVEPFGANLQSKTEQTVDDYGNVTQSRLYNYGNFTTPARTYTNTYLNTSNYTSRNIRNRLLTAQVTDGTNTVTLVTLPDGSISTYAYSGNTTTVTDPGGKWKTYTTDALGNLVQVTEPNPQGGADHQTYYTYNLLGQLTQVQMPRGAVTQNRYFNYDLTTGRLTSATNPENGTVSYTYNADGTTLRKTDARSKAVEFSYDSYQRVTQKRTYPWGGSTEDPCGRVDFYYDTNPLESNWPSAWGQLMAMRWSNASCPGNQFTESYQYGAGNVVTYKRLRAPILTAGNYTSSTDNLDASFSYTNEGQLGQIHYPTWFNNGTPGLNITLSYAFDTLRRPVSATDQNGIHWANNATYAPDGAPTAVTFVGAYDPGYDIYGYYNETRSYNVRGQLTRMTAGNYADLEYRFSATNNDGRITQQKDWKSGKEINYEYDSLGRLSSAYTTGPQWGQSFTYDGFGNLTAEVATKGTAPTSYLNYNGTTNRIVTAGYGYDNSGNLTSMPDLTLTYDTDSRLTQAVHTTNGTERYGYNPLGQRVWKQWAGGGGYEGTYEVFFYGVKGELLASFQYAGGPSYSTGLRQGPMYYFAGRKFWTGTTQGTWEDRLGSKVNTSGTYFPYGDQPLTQYATYNRDATNLDYAQQRYYSSQIARFTTADPYEANGGGSGDLADPQSWNRYTYTGGDPINRIDPHGACYFWIGDPSRLEGPPNWCSSASGMGGPRRPQRLLPLDGPPWVDKHELFNKKLRNQTKHALEDLDQRCKDALNATGINLGTVGAVAAGTDYFNAAGPEGTMTVNQVTGFSGPWPPGLEGANLSMWLGDNRAVVLPNFWGGTSNVVVVGTSFFNNVNWGNNTIAESQNVTLVHEALHTGTGLNDVGLFNKLGFGELGDTPENSSAAANAITIWLATDCAPIK